MKSFFQVFWSRRILRLVLIATFMQFVTTPWSTTNYFGWGLWVGAMSISWLSMAFSVISDRRFTKAVKALKPQIDYWEMESLRLFVEARQISIWDAEAQTRMMNQMRVAHHRYLRELDKLRELGEKSGRFLPELWREQPTK